VIVGKKNIKVLTNQEYFANIYLIKHF